MNKMQEKIHNAVRSIACNMAEKEPREWPPKCLILTYQPMRPSSTSTNENKSLRKE